MAPATTCAKSGPAMTSVLVHYNFEEDDDTLNMTRASLALAQSDMASSGEGAGPPALPFLLRKVRHEDWLDKLPWATRDVLERAARATPEKWNGSERIPGAIALPIN